jgi:hypothetical protein
VDLGAGLHRADRRAVAEAVDEDLGALAIDGERQLAGVGDRDDELLVGDIRQVDAIA